MDGQAPQTRETETAAASARARARGVPLLVAVMIAVLLGLTLWQAALWGERSALQAIRMNGERRLTLYSAALESEMERYAYLPRILAETKEIKAALLSPDDLIAVDTANRYLERINTFADASATYVMDRDGLTLAASNWRSERSFVGRNFKFRPYFKAALSGDLGRYFALGTTSLEPGYYLSRPVYQDYDADREVIGVIVVKVGMERLETAWAGGAVEAMVSDKHGIVFIASEPAWRFHALEPLGEEQRRRIRASRQYHDAPLEPLDLDQVESVGGGRRIVSLPDAGGRAEKRGASARKDYLMQTRTIPETGWELHVLSPVAKVEQAMLTAAAVAGLIFAILAMTGLYVVQRRRRYSDRLAYQQEVAAALEEARAHLEIRVRERTADLHRTQAELLQAGKLAVLGKLSTSINHELNQPLGAIRSYSDNARAFLERGRLDEARGNLQAISELTERMAAIVTRLKGFARKSKADVGPVPVAPAIRNALNLLEPRLRKEGVEVVADLPGNDIRVMGGSVRLEQVFVNLFANAVDAMAGRETRVLSVLVDETGDEVLVRVADTGHGLPEEEFDQLFEPFHTTKDAGEGLGIGLSISYSILQNFGGAIEAANRPKGGAQFTVRLKRAAEDA